MDQLYSEKGGEMVFDFFQHQEAVGHNRVPSKHSYYWVTEPIMRYHLEKLLFTSARVHFSACVGSIPSLRSFLSHGRWDTWGVSWKSAQIPWREWLPLKSWGSTLRRRRRRSIRRVAMLTEDSGLVLGVWGWFSACPWSWTCAQICAGMHACVIPQLLSELKHIVNFLPSSSAICNSTTKPWQSPLTQSQMAWIILSEVAMLSSNSVGQAFPQWMTSLLRDQTLRGSSATLAIMESLMLLVLGAMLRWNSAGSHFRMGAFTARTWVWTCVHAFVLCVSEHGCMAFIN